MRHPPALGTTLLPTRAPICSGAALQLARADMVCAGPPGFAANSFSLTAVDTRTDAECLMIAGSPLNSTQQFTHFPSAAALLAKTLKWGGVVCAREGNSSCIQDKVKCIL